MRLKKGDQVIVIAGKDKGRKGKIEKVLPSKNSVLIPGINIVKKHVKPKGEGKPGGIVDVPKPIHVSKVALLCSKCGKPTKIGYLTTKEGLPAGPLRREASKAGKERICKKCQAVI